MDLFPFPFGILLACPARCPAYNRSATLGPDIEIAQSIIGRDFHCLARRITPPFLESAGFPPVELDRDLRSRKVSFAAKADLLAFSPLLDLLPFRKLFP